MLNYYQKLRADFRESQVPGEGFTWWFIRRIAPDWLRYLIVAILLGGFLWLWSNPAWLVYVAEALIVIALIAFVIEIIRYGDYDSGYDE